MSASTQVDRSFAGQLLPEREPGTFFVSSTEIKRYAVREGFGAWFTFVYAGDDEPNPDVIVDTDSGVVRISAETCTFMGNVLCVRVAPNFGIPVENFLTEEEPDDKYGGICTDRWFATEAEAKQHVASVMALAPARIAQPYWD